MREPYPFNCSLTAKPCCGLPGPLPCVSCNASTPVGCTGFAFSSVDVPGVETPNTLTAWGAEATNNHPHLHGYFVEDFSDRYLNISSVYAKNATDASLTVGAAPTPQKVGARFYALNLLSELDEPGEYYIERSTRTPEAAARFGTALLPPTCWLRRVQAARVCLRCDERDFAGAKHFAHYFRRAAYRALTIHRGRTSNYTVRPCVVAGQPTSDGNQWVDPKYHFYEVRHSQHGPRWPRAGAVQRLHR